MIGISILSVVVLLGVLIFVHELGHFLAAKYAGVGVLKFSLGFGPKLIGRKVGETEYLLSLIPLGGYVKLLGESPDDELPPEENQRSFLKQNVWKRIMIVAAGPLFNVFFAIFVFTYVVVPLLLIIQSPFSFETSCFRFWLPKPSCASTYLRCVMSSSSSRK